MKNKIIVSLVLVLPLLVYFILLSFNSNGIAEQTANAKNDLPQVIVFSTPMCGECKRMAPVVEQAKQNYKDKINIIKINAVDNKPSTEKLVRQHKIYLVPTIVYLDKQGNVVNRTEGSMSYAEFEKFLKDLTK
ncbi:MAG: thioredoxin family protein [Candidatus Gastranaerophilales bacterium]|nr:thioredoxin family protein [Candidatus Gastranaerophilales bacterium]